MSNEHGSTSMGDLFAQRRAARRHRQQQGGPPEPVNTSSSDGPRRSSFLDIQAQQERERQQQERFPSSSRYNRSNNSGSRGSRRQRSYHQQDTSDLPLECGLIASLKESFGFIYCADRPEEIFFHYSQLENCRVPELNVDDEVEFRVGPSRNDDSKMSAYNVRVLEPGTIVWETEEEPGKRWRGLVERPVRMTDRERGTMSEGSIRVLTEETKDGEQDEDGQDTTVLSLSDKGGPLVRFSANEYTPASPESGGDKRSFRRSDSSGGRLGRGDLVEFAIVTERRTKNKMAKSITLLQSERERQRIAKEKELLANATLERGVVTTLKNDFGFLRSNKRREEVYFHYSNVSLPSDEDDQDEHVLKEGQEMEFLVVTETASVGAGGKRDKISARQVKFLPSGSVVFHTLIAEGVTGIITRCPHPVDSSYASEMLGRVRLNQAIQSENDETSEEVREVVLKAADAPGGSYSANRDGSSVGLWVREGDTLLFDVVKELVDDSYCATPTKHTRPVEKGRDPQQEGTASTDANGKTKKAIRVVSLSLAGRAEGVIHAVKDNYGFISIAERPVDVYFRLYEVLPEDMQLQLRQNMLIGEAATEDEPFKLTVGTAVQFDLSLQGRIPSSSSFSSQRSRRGGEKDSLKAQRVLLLPPSSIVQTKVLAQDIKGVVNKEDPKQPYAGLIELEEEVKSMSLEELHPLVAKLVDSILANIDQDGGTSVIFPDLQSIKDDHIVIKMVETRGHGELCCSYIPSASGDANHPGRLCIKPSNEQSSAVESKTHSDPNGATQKDSIAKDETVPEDVDDNDKSETSSGHPSPPTKKESKKKKKQHKTKTVKLLRYDKHSLAKELQGAMPLGKDDVVLCDVVQSRRTNMVSLSNIRVAERKQIERGVLLEGADGAEKTAGVGIVSEVVNSRQFGFISVLDENSTKREMLFFHVSNVVVPDEGDADKGSTPGAKSRDLSDGGVIRKGDEVKFEIGIGKNGKPVANNIRVVPRGTLNIPAKADKNACRGLVLMEPSHTSLGNTPARQLAGGKLSAAGAGRWDVGTARSSSGPSVKEEGSILLVTDPANVFSAKVQVKGEKLKEKASTGSSHSVEGDKTSQPENSEAEDNGAVGGVVGEEAVAPTQSETPFKRLSYKNGALALHGPGASTMSDKSNAPRRGDLVSFGKAKSGKGVRDVRVVTRGAATRVRGRLQNIVLSASANADGELEVESPGTAKFVASTEKEEEYQIDLNEVVSCDPSILKDRESVEGILHEGRIYGVCRTTDLYLESKLGASHKERPRLNLTVRKDRGGKIMAQSMMAKGPDNTVGFAPGWTKRVSQYEVVPEPETASVPSEEVEEPEGAVEDAAVTESV